jgi:HEAT repeat protein
VSDLPKKPDLKTTLEALEAGKPNEIPSSTIFYGLSRLTNNEIKQVAPVWETLDPDYRRGLLRALTEMSETNFEFDYRSIGFLGLTDNYAPVREAAIDVLWEDETPELMRVLMQIAKNDEAAAVRAMAAMALGRFILMGELGDLPEREAAKAQEIVVGLLNNPDEDLDVRRRALEAISNSSHDIIPDAIKTAYESDERKMRLSAIYAMGRSYDSRWEKVVLRELDNHDPEIRFEAVRASGELELQESVPKLVRLIDDADRETLEMVVWALGEIGGREAIRILNQMMVAAEDDNDDELVEALDEAIGNASIVGGDLFGDLGD